VELQHIMRAEKLRC